MMMEMGGGMIAMMIAAWVFHLALLVLAVLCIVWLARNLRRPAVDPQTIDNAEEVARRRYAAGEISDDEYHQRVAGLQAKGY
jgi:putative membrane protein